MARVYSQKHMYREAVREADAVLRAMPDSSVGLTERAHGLGVGGSSGEARKILQQLENRSRHESVPVYNLAIIHVAWGENEAALLDLQKAYDERDWALMVLAVEPRLDLSAPIRVFRKSSAGSACTRNETGHHSRVAFRIFFL